MGEPGGDHPGPGYSGQGEQLRKVEPEWGVMEAMVALFPGAVRWGEQ